MFPYGSRKDRTCPKLFTFIAWKQKKNLKWSELRKIVLDSSPSDGSFCSSENMDDRRTEPKPKLFISARILQNKGLKPEKLPWFSGPGEGVLRTLETNYSLNRCDNNNILL